MSIKTDEDFRQVVAEVEAQPGYQRPAAFAIGIARYASSEPEAAVLDTWYPVVNLDENHGTAAILARIAGHTSGSASYRLGATQVGEAVTCFAPYAGDRERGDSENGAGAERHQEPGTRNQEPGTALN